MSRDDGFPVMDVSTDYVNDPKWRRLHRASPELFPAAFVAYTATMCESWKAGRRVALEDAWPAILPYDERIKTALVSAGFLDRRGLIRDRSWSGWFGPANRRRNAARNAGREGNAKRWGGDRVAIGSASGGDPRSYRTVPTVPSVPTDPLRPPNARELEALKERKEMPEHISSVLGRIKP